MPIAGAAHSPWLFWDGRKDSLWSQALGPLEDAAEHGSNRTRLASAEKTRGARMASSSGMPRSSTLLNTCKIAPGMRSLPAAPITSTGLPSCNTMVGVISVWSRAPGSGEERMR